MRLMILALALFTTALCVQPAAAQQGMTEPLRSPIISSRGDTFKIGTVYADVYRIYVEPVFGVNQGVEVTFTTTSGTVMLPQSRVRRFPKEELHYNAVNWQGVPVGTHTVSAMITWPDGIGGATGNFYQAGMAIVDFDVAITAN